MSRNLWKRAEYVEKAVWSRDSPEEASGSDEPGGLQWNSTLQSLITCSRSDKGACGRCQGQGWGGRPGCGEEAGAGEVWKVSKHNGPLGPPLPWPQDHRERQCLLLILILQKTRARQRSVWNRNSEEQVYPDVVRSWEGRRGRGELGTQKAPCGRPQSRARLNLNVKMEDLQAGGGARDGAGVQTTN